MDLPWNYGAIFQISLSVGVTSPSGESTNTIFIRSNGNTVFQFLLDKTVLYLEYRIAAEGTTSELISLRFQDPTPGIWKLQVQASQLGDGELSYLASCSGVSEYGGLFSGIGSKHDDHFTWEMHKVPLRLDITMGTNQSIGVNSGTWVYQRKSDQTRSDGTGRFGTGNIPGRPPDKPDRFLSGGSDHLGSCGTFAGMDLRAAIGAESGRGRAEKPADPGCRPERRDFLSVQRMGLWNVESGKCIFTDP